MQFDSRLIQATVFGVRGVPIGPPYVPHTVALVGGIPTVSTDIPISSVFLAFYIIAGICHMTIFQINRRRGYKFIMSWAMFGFCMARNFTFVLRIVWATRHNNASLIIAAQIFSGAGVLVAYIVVLLLALRIFRATHPELGWNGKLRRGLFVAYFGLFMSLVLNITFTVISFYTLDTKLKKDCLWVQRASVLCQLSFNIISVVLLSLSVLLPRAANSENFGTGSMRAKIIIVSTALFFCLSIVGFRTGTLWEDPRPISNPAWYQSKEAYYLIEMALELPVLYGFLLVRFDKIFWVPNGSCKPGDYSWTECQELSDSPEAGADSESGGSSAGSGKSIKQLQKEGT